ncbi:MAG: tetratricopeptide repeat protein [Sandaracinaceae bacterium]|nr:tetratricopeptide repeat protein [Sandaracinaceae bacterium]
MSFFGRLFGGDPDTHRRNADAHFERGAFGEAKLAYEKARDALPSDRRSERDGMAARIDACRDGIARTRLAQAQAYRTQGERSLAAEELRGALEVAADRALGAEIQAVLDDLDRVEVQQANRGVTLSRDERIAILAGSWYEEQATEYASYGDEFFEALLALDDERFEDARAGFAQVLKTAEAPIYVILEHAKACTLVGDSAAATAGYVRFLEALPEGAGGERRLAAHLQIGVLRSLGGDPEGALDAFQGAIEDFPDDHRPYFALGQQLRLSGAPGEALEVLELSLDRAGASPEWALIEEIGITCADLGQLARATELLEDVLKRFVDRGDAYIPPRTAWRLAALFEQQGRMDRAADVWRMLAERGPESDRARAHGEAGRLLAAIGLDDEARRMLKRGLVLARQAEAADAAEEAEQPEERATVSSSQPTEHAEASERGAPEQPHARMPGAPRPVSAAALRADLEAKLEALAD